MVAKLLINIFVLAALLVGGVFLFSMLQIMSFTSLSSNYVETDSLLSRPEFYNNKRVCTVGTYDQAGNEIGTLTPLGNTTLPRQILISAPVETTLFESLKQKTKESPEYTGTTVRVCGAFQHAESDFEGFGPSERFKYQIRE